MAGGPRVGLVCEGDASRSDTVFSGTAKRLYYALEAKGLEMFPVDASLPKLQRGLAALGSFSTNRGQWRSRFRYGNYSAKLRGAAAKAALGTKPVDFLLQVGATLDPPRMGAVPFGIYADWNMALSRQQAASGQPSGALTAAEYEAIDREHARRYRAAAVVFTISERLRQSFIELYQLPAEHVLTAYAGPNFEQAVIEEALSWPRQSEAPTLLFIAKEFQRKGGPTVAAALAKIQASLPQTRLLFAGTAELPEALRGLPNVEHLGLLDKAIPEQRKRLLQAYRDADALLLPSHADPFPTVVREAMFLGVPCVVSNIWAMPEMVVEGETGFLVNPGDADALADRSLRVLQNRELGARFGAAARKRAQAMFSWDAVAEVFARGIRASIGR